MNRPKNNNYNVMRHLNTNEFRIYETRYLFQGDNLIGRLDLPKAAFEFCSGFERTKLHAFSFINQSFGIDVREVSDIRVDKTTLLEPLPDEVAAIKDPALGFRTPEVMKWISANRPDDYETIYGVKPGPSNADTVTISITSAPDDKKSDDANHDNDVKPVAKKAAKKAARKVARKVAKNADAATGQAPIADSDATGKPDVDDGGPIRTPLAGEPGEPAEETM